MNWAWRTVLQKHGWKQSQCSGAWIRTHEFRRSEIVGGPYIPKYGREVQRLLKQKGE